MVDRVARSFSLRKPKDKDKDKPVRGKIRHENSALGMGAVQGGAPPSAFSLPSRMPLPPGLASIDEQRPPSAASGYVPAPSQPQQHQQHHRPQLSMSQRSVSYPAPLDSPAEGMIPPISESVSPAPDSPVPSRPARSVRRPSAPVTTTVRSERSEALIPPVGGSRGLARRPSQPQFAVATPSGLSAEQRGGRRDRRPVSAGDDSFEEEPEIPLPSSGRSHIFPDAPRRTVDPRTRRTTEHQQQSDRLRPERRTTEEPDTSPLGSLTARQEDAPQALRGAVAALQSAGRKHQVDRIRGVGMEHDTSPMDLEQLLHVKRRPLAAYERAAEKSGHTPPELLAIDAVMRKARSEWAPLARDDMNPAALALDLIDSPDQGELEEEFQRMLALLDAALQGSVEDHYEAFAAAITRHHHVLSALGLAQKNVGNARRKLNDARDALSARRGDLVSLWQKSQAVQESLRLLDTAERLRDTPTALERLIASKLFYDAVTLVMVAERTANSPEMQDISATAEVRAYLEQQQHAILDLITEELHNHLYLKAPADDSLWTPYEPGQTELQASPLDRAATTAAAMASTDENVDAYADTDLPATGVDVADDLEPPTPLSALDRFLTRLSAPGTSTGGRYSARAGGSVTLADAPALADSGPAAVGLTAGLGLGSSTGLGLGTEADSDPFAYIEMLLESAAKLGKLFDVLEAVAQRQQAELHQLVEGTLDEVERRHDAETQWGNNLNRRLSSAPWANRSSLSVPRNSTGGARTLTFSGASTGGPNSALLALTNLAPGALGGKSASEVYDQARDEETLRDLFWTLFAKFDAVLQCYRVVYEVCSRLSTRPGEATRTRVGDRAVVKPRVLWRNMQDQLQGILSAHLAAGSDDDSNLTPGAVAASARRTMVDINEVLRLGRVDRDTKKRLFSLATDPVAVVPPTATHTTAVTTSGGTNRIATRKYEEQITSTIRTYLPGLVSTDTTGPVGNGGFASELAAIDLSAWLGAGGHSAPEGGAAHRTLAKPDVAHLSKLFGPVLVFVSRVKRVLPAGETEMEDEDDEYASSRGRRDDEEDDPNVGATDLYASFLKRFVRHTFLPHLEARVQAQFSNAIAGLDVVPGHEDATVDSAVGRSEMATTSGDRSMALLPSSLEDGTVGITGDGKPVSKAIPNTVHLLQDTYMILQHMPFQKRRVARLMAVLVVDLYQRATARYSALVTRDADPDQAGNSVRGKYACAQWASNLELVSILTEAIHPATSKERKDALLAHEGALLASLSDHGAKVTLEQLLPEPARRRMVALATLKHSIDSFTRYLHRLKPVATLPQTVVEPEALSKPSTVLELPLTDEMVRRFQGLPTTFDHLSRTILFTLRAELRFQAAWYIYLATADRRTSTTSDSNAPFVTEEASLEPDPNINAFNDKLASWDDALSLALPDQDRMLLYEGLARFMDGLVLSAICRIRAINRNGVSKLERNVRALEQNIKALALTTQVDTQVDVSLGRSRALFDLLLLPPKHVLDRIQRTGTQYSFEQYTAVLNLVLGLDNVSNAATPAPLPNAGTLESGLDAARAQYSELLIELHQVFDHQEPGT